MKVNISTGVGANSELAVNTSGQVAVIPETSLTTGKARVGAVKMVSENDPGGITGSMYLKSPETSSDYRLRVGVDSILFEDTFNASAQNSWNWSYVLATLSCTQPGAGTLNFGTVQGTTNAHGAHMRTFQYFPLVNTAPLAVEFLLGMFISPLVSGEVFRFGIGLPGSAILPPTDGIMIQITSAGIEGIISYNGTPTSTGIVRLYNTLTLDEMYKFSIVVGEREIEYWMDDQLLAEQDIPAANGVPWLGVSAPLFMMKYNTGAVTNTNQVRVSRVGATLMDIASNRNWGMALSCMGRSLFTGQNGHAQGNTVGNFTAVGAVPGTQGGSNTTPNAAMAGLGGLFQMTAQVGALTASGDMIASYYLNPAHTINVTGRNLVIKAVKISTVNMGAAVATTPTTLLWGIAHGCLTNTMAVVETGSFVTATAHIPRHIPLGMQWLPVAAVVGQVYNSDIFMPFDAAPIVVRPGEYLHTTVRFLVGTATASQTIVYTITFDGYFE